MQKITKKYFRLIILGLAMVLALISFAGIVEEVFHEPKEGDTEAIVLDQRVLTFLHQYRSPELNQSMIDITALGSFSVIALLTVVIVILLISQKDWTGILYVFLIIAGSSIIPAVLKNLFARERPDVLGRLAEVKSHSFPSGHSFSATVSYLALAYLVSREIKNIKLEILYYILALIVILLVGTSRMYLGVHFPTDVLAGISLGIAWFVIVSIPFVYTSKRRVDNENI